MEERIEHQDDEGEPVVPSRGGRVFRNRESACGSQANERSITTDNPHPQTGAVPCSEHARNMGTRVACPSRISFVWLAVKSTGQRGIGKLEGRCLKSNQLHTPETTTQLFNTGQVFGSTIAQAMAFLALSRSAKFSTAGVED